MRYHRSLADGSATVDDLSNAVGGLWTSGVELDSLLANLHGHAQAGRIVAGGIDVQLGSATARYAQHELAGELAAMLPAPDAAACETRITRHNQWRYDADQPFDADERAALTGCIERIGNRLSETEPADAELQRMAASYAQHLRVLGDDGTSALSEGLFENLRWYRDRVPAGRGIVVWTATVHALRDPLVGDDSAPRLGERLHRLLADDLVSIGFSALGGAYGRGGSLQALEPASLDSLEALAFADEYSAFAYLDHAALLAAGTRPSRALDYGHWRSTDWSTRLDGLLILREERPIEVAGQAKP